jgi:hypothetical protein
LVFFPIYQNSVIFISLETEWYQVSTQHRDHLILGSPTLRFWSLYPEPLEWTFLLDPCGVRSPSPKQMLYTSGCPCQSSNLHRGIWWGVWLPRPDF